MLVQDLRRALRSLRERPLTAAIAVVTLGLGLGGNTAAYSWIDALLLRPYPFADLEALVMIWERHPQAAGNVSSHGRSTGDRNPVAPADYLDIERESRAFEELAAFEYQELFLVAEGEPERLRGVRATPDLLGTLGIEVAHGRGFLTEEGQPGRDQVLLLSDGFWRRRFAADPGVLGKEVLLEDKVYTVVGVLPAYLQYPLGGVEVWTPLAFTDVLANERARLSLRVVGRLDRAVGMKAAQAEIDAIAERLEQVHPRTNTGRGLTLAPLREQQVGMLPPFLFLLQGAAVLVLLIACANTTSLLLARVAARQRELALRTALGAGRFRVARLVLLEGLILSLLGGGLAIVLAWVGASVIRASLPQSVAMWVGGWSEIRVAGSELGVTLLVACLTGLLAGLVPALRASRGDLASVIKDGGALGSGGPRRQRISRAVVLSELVLALVLTSSAALLVQGFRRLVDSYQDLDPKGVLTFELRLPEERYPQPHQIAGFYGRLVEELGALPGVKAAALVSHLPADQGPIPGSSFAIEGRPAVTPQELPSADLQTVSATYFDSLRIPLRAGRALRVDDDSGAVPVVVVSESLARRFFPGEERVHEVDRAQKTWLEDSLGRRLKLGSADEPGPWLTVVGVVADVKQYWFDAAPRPTLYLPYQQAPGRSTFIVLRTDGDPAAYAEPARRCVWGLDASQPVEEVRTMEYVVAEAMAFLRTAAGLITTMAVLACVLAAVGIYGLLGHHVAQATQELGVRMALGAGRREVMRLVLGQVASLAAIGLAIGVPAAFGLGRLLSSALFGVVGTDPVLLAGIAGLLGGVALLAGYLPARRAASLDPVVALRER